MRSVKSIFSDALVPLEKRKRESERERERERERGETTVKLVKNKIVVFQPCFNSRTAQKDFNVIENGRFVGCSLI